LKNRFFILSVFFILQFAVVLFLRFSLSACGLLACGGLRSQAIAQAQNRKLNEPLLRRWMRRSDIMAHLI